jgi:hypothetical protein
VHPEATCKFVKRWREDHALVGEGSVANCALEETEPGPDGDVVRIEDGAGAGRLDGPVFRNKDLVDGYPKKSPQFRRPRRR